VLVPAPSYPLFEYLARYCSVEPVAYRLRYDGAWHVDFDSLQRAISGRTRAVIAVSPNNPTGSYLTREEWQRLGGLGLPLICDEVFARYPLAEGELQPHSALSVLQHPAAPVFALDGLSKYAGLPQLKLGSIVFRAPPDSASELIWRLQAIADTFLSVSTPVQVALPQLLELSRPVHRAIAQRSAHNLRQLQAQLLGSAATVLRCEGGWSAVVQLPLTGEHEDWALRLLGEQHVLVQPGWFYDFEADSFVVLSLLTPESTFCEGVGRIVAALR
jgi:aspartate/methionine/tyrosine aminotransferase